MLQAAECKVKGPFWLINVHLNSSIAFKNRREHRDAVFSKDIRQMMREFEFGEVITNCDNLSFFIFCWDDIHLLLVWRLKNCVEPQFAKPLSGLYQIKRGMNMKRPTMVAVIAEIKTAPAARSLVSRANG